MSKAKIGFISLGCPKNQTDTEIMIKSLSDAGYPIVAEDIDADIIVINTCAFIESAKKEAIDNILDVAWLKENRNLKGIVVTGCLPERYREEVLESMPEIDALLGVNSIHDIVKAVRSIENKSKTKFTSFKNQNELVLGGERIITTEGGFAYLKIAEGCDNRCTYCAIPDIRGGFRSRPVEDIIKEAKYLEKQDIREIVLVAQDTTRYGEDLYGEYKLSELIHRLCEETKAPFFRILYCYPDKITDSLISEYKNNPRLIKYIDLPIQHINDELLRRMNRHGNSAVIKDAIKRLRSVDGMIIRSTVITGFPGESEEQFEELCEFIMETKFERLGAFAYSREEGTPAYDFDNQIQEQVKQDRADKIMERQAEISAENNKKMLSKIVKVICEGYDVVSESYYGRSYADAPEIDGKIYFQSPDIKRQVGEFLDVEITDTLDYDLIGEALI